MTDTTPAPASTIRTDLLLLTELYPPAVGGSAVLYENIYGRLIGAKVTVLTDVESSPGPDREWRDRLHIVRKPIKTRQWGFATIRGDLHHIRVAARLRALAVGRQTVVHCGRALPEGVAALVSRLSGGPRFTCWAHGEDISTSLTSREMSYATRAVLRGAALVFANSENTARILESVGVSRRKVRVVHPGVDASRFRPDVDGSAIRARYAPNDETLILSVGRFQRRKGHDKAIAAIGRLRKERPELRYLVLSDGEERPRLEALVREHGVGSQVIFAGEVPFADLPAYYAACDIFAMPNRVDGADIEGFGIVFIEAQATARPVIGGRSGGVPEAVADGEVGVLVGGEDVEELATAIDMLAGSPELRRHMGEAGRSRVLAHFTWDRAAEAVAQAHQQVAAERHFP